MNTPLLTQNSSMKPIDCREDKGFVCTIKAIE